MSKEIPLTRGCVAVVDDGDYEWLMQWKWQAHKWRNGFYATRCVRQNGKKISVAMHREIMSAARGIEVDHIDGNGLNNVRKNLRLATHAQNLANQRPQIRNSHGLKGITWQKQIGRWCAQIKVSGRRIHIGTFSTPREAAIAYDSAAKKYFGDFAKTNFP